MGEEEEEGKEEDEDEEEEEEEAIELEQGVVSIAFVLCMCDPTFRNKNL